MMVSCVTCSATIPAEDLQLDRLIAKCRSCNSVFEFSAQIAKPAPMRPALPPKPEGLVVRGPTGPVTGGYRQPGTAHGALEIERRWFTPQHVFMLLFCVFWDGFLVNWYAHVPRDLSAWVFPLLHVAFGVCLTYATLTGFLNRTVVTLTDDAVTVRHGPLPWPGNRSLGRASISQLVSDYVLGKGRHATTTYRLSAVVDGSKVKLLSALPSRDQALYIQRCIEQRFGLES